MCHLEDKTLKTKNRTDSGRRTSVHSGSFLLLPADTCEQIHDDGMLTVRIFFPLTDRIEENQVNKYCCRSAERVHTTTLSSDRRPCGRADLLADAGLTTGQTGPSEKPASKAIFRDYVSTCMLSRCCPVEILPRPETV